MKGRSKVKDAMKVCAFCEKGEHECSRLVAGPTVYICTDCVREIAENEQLVIAQYSE